MGTHNLETQNGGQLLLFLGADGSGKSTAIANVHERLETEWSVERIEQTKSPELLEFKKKNCARLVDGNYVDERENLFERSNRDYIGKIADARSRSEYTLLDGHPVITAVSHDLMRQVICDENQERHIDPSERLNKLGAACLPSLVVYLSAEASERKRRISSRRVVEEQQWGFNAPFFLDQYQPTLAKCARRIAEFAGGRLLEVDTVVLDEEAVADTIAEAAILTAAVR